MLVLEAIVDAPSGGGGTGGVALAVLSAVTLLVGAIAGLLTARATGKRNYVEGYAGLTDQLQEERDRLALSLDRERQKREALEALCWANSLDPRDAYREAQPPP